jgi:hypothetical protein
VLQSTPSKAMLQQPCAMPKRLYEPWHGIKLVEPHAQLTCSIARSARLTCLLDDDKPTYAPDIAGSNCIVRAPDLAAPKLPECSIPDSPGGPTHRRAISGHCGLGNEMNPIGGKRMPATDDLHGESGAKIDDRAPDRRPGEAVLGAGCACTESPILTGLGVSGSEVRAAEDRSKRHLLQTPDGTWAWRSLRVEAESEKRFATLVAAMQDADRHGHVPRVSKFGRIERIDDDRLNGLHEE